MHKQVSIIVPAFNVQDYIDTCVASLVSQSYEDLDILLVDDGSTDKTGMLCDEWAERDARVRSMHKPNGGLSDARNFGIEHAHGSYLSFVDADDWVEPGFVELMIQAITNSGKRMSTCARYVDFQSKRVIKLEHEYCELDIDGALSELLTYGAIDVAAWDKIYEASLFENVRYPLHKKSEDTYVIADLIIAAGGCVVTGLPLYHYRKRTGSITDTYNGADLVQVSEGCERLLSVVRAYSRNLEQEARYFECRWTMEMLGAAMSVEREGDGRASQLLRQKLRDTRSQWKHNRYLTLRDQLKIALELSGLFRFVIR